MNSAGFPHKELTLVFMVRIHWAEDWSEALNAHLPAFLGQRLALKPPWWLTVILQDPSPDKISLCRTDLETFYTLSHRLTLSEGFSRRGFIRGCLSVVDLSHSLCLTHGIQSLLGLCTQGYILWNAACALVWATAQTGLWFLLQQQRKECALA